MDITELDKARYPELRLDILQQIILDYVTSPPYVSFVQAIYLCQGRQGEPSYALLFEVPFVQKDQRGLHLQFEDALRDRSSLYGILEKAYRGTTAAQKNPSGITKAIDDWIWYEVTDANDLQGEGLELFVIPANRVCLFTRE